MYILSDLVIIFALYRDLKVYVSYLYTIIILNQLLYALIFISRICEMH